MTHKKGSNPPPPAGAVKPPPPTDPPPRFVPLDTRSVEPRSRPLPILTNYDHTAEPIGFITIRDGCYIATFKPGKVRVDALVELGGGWRVHEYEHVGPGEEYVLEAELLCLSTVINPKGKT